MPKKKRTGKKQPATKAPLPFNGMSIRDYVAAKLKNEFNVESSPDTALASMRRLLAMKEKTDLGEAKTEIAIRAAAKADGSIMKELAEGRAQAPEPEPAPKKKAAPKTKSTRKSAPRKKAAEEAQPVIDEKPAVESPDPDGGNGKTRKPYERLGARGLVLELLKLGKHTRESMIKELMDQLGVPEKRANWFVKTYTYNLFNGVTARKDLAGKQLHETEKGILQIQNSA